MKVKNLMFSGFAAAMFAGVIGGADAATYNLASKDYVDTKITDIDTAIEKKQDKLTAGTGVTIDTVDGVTTIDTKPVQIGEQDVSVADAITNVTNEITNITNVLGEIPDGTTVQAELDKKEDVANKVSGNLTADELNGMSAEDKSNKYPSIGAAMAIATAMVGEISDDVADLTNLKSQVEGLESVVGDETAGLVKDVDDLQSADVAMGGRVDTLESDVGTLETTVGNEESGLVKDVTDLKSADATMGGRVDTLESDVNTLEGNVQTLQDANYINTDGKGLGGYIIKADGQGGYELLDVAIVDGTGKKDLITDTDLITVTE